MSERVPREKPRRTAAATTELVSVVVERENEPDQYTVYHPETSGVDRMSSWITVDHDVVVDLFQYK